ncbi:MAG: bacE, partial [Thermoleophilia bacterium]|nr:bacE [Thermoleophilia bacterium]
MRPEQRSTSSSTNHTHRHARRDVARIAASRGISMAGAEAGYIALLALAWHLTGSASDASLVLLASIFARTAGAPLVGWIGDHLDRKLVTVVAELAAAVAFGSLAFAHSIWHLLLAMVVGTFAAACGGAALDAALPNLVPEADLARANSVLGMARTTGHMLGPVLGGLLVATVGARSAFLLDGLSSVVAAACLFGIRGSVGGSVARHAGAVTERARRGMLVGVRHIADDGALRRLAIGWAGMCVC